MAGKSRNALHLHATKLGLKIDLTTDIRKHFRTKKQAGESAYLCCMRPEEYSILKSFIPGIILAAVMWLVKGAEIYFHTDYHQWGIYPMSLEAWTGIFTMPFVHDDLKHLFSNTVPLIILIAALVYFYRSIALKVILLVWVLDGVWVWLGARPAWHIGASGVVYGLAAFLFFSGVVRKHINLMALSLLIAFLYGGLIWGIFPLMIGMSWEAHLYGGIAGALLAFVYRGEGPQRKIYDWENEDDSETDTPEQFELTEQQEETGSAPTTQIRYDYIESSKDLQQPDSENNAEENKDDLNPK